MQPFESGDCKTARRSGCSIKLRRTSRGNVARPVAKRRDLRIPNEGGASDENVTRVRLGT